MSHASSPFEALNSMCLSIYERYVRPPVEMRWGSRDFSRVSTGDSDIPLTRGMKDEPAIKSLQGNLDLFRVRALGVHSYRGHKFTFPLTYL